MINNKALGQHWLYNRAVLEEIAELAYVPGVETCVEIGPGLGTLTTSLLKRFSRVVAVELDEGLAKNLPASFPGTGLEVVNEDILKFDFTKIEEPYVVAGNIPYYITSPILERVMRTENVPAKVVLLIQKEVAERIVGESESVLSLKVKNRADVTLGPVVVKEEFTPPPKVDSRVIILEPHAPVVDDKVFKLIHIGFSAPRKKLVNNLGAIRPADEMKDIFLMANINIDVRPADLSLKDWEKLYQKIYK